MKKHLISFCCLSFLFLSTAIAGPGAIKDHPYFKAVTGKWSGEGDISIADGTVIHVKESWEGKAQDDGTFVVSGSRNWGEEKQDFKWVFSHNETTDLYECEYTFTGLETPMHFEVSLSDDSAELKSPFGEPGGELQITNKVKNDTLTGNVVYTSVVGIELMTGTVTHTRSKE